MKHENSTFNTRKIASELARDMLAGSSPAPAHFMALATVTEAFLLNVLIQADDET